jgi:3-isopropylmalate dehydratase, large subunit (EC 4.2.1.33)
MTSKTLFEKVWEQHEVVPETPDTPAVLYIDLHLVHEVTSPQAFSLLRSKGLKVRRTDRTLATMDHSTPTDPDEVFGRVPIKVESAARQVKELEKNCREFGVELLGLGSDQRGIVHVIGPELGATQPGKTIVCGDSHTATHGAFGALAFGIGTTEVGHVLATQCLLQRRPKTLAINVHGRLQPGVTAKDLILAIIGKIGVSGGTGHVIEYRGPAIEALSMDERMTICNMSIEAGARAGMIAPDETTYAYLKGRRFAPQGADWDRAVERWRSLRTDPGAKFDREVDIDADALEPMITYGTHPGMVVPISGVVPTASNDPVHEKSLAYMGLTAGERLQGKPIGTSSSSAAAQTHACRISSSLRASSRVGRSRAACACSSCRVRSRSSAKRKRAVLQRSSPMRAPSGASRVARCASA